MTRFIISELQVEAFGKVRMAAHRGIVFLILRFILLLLVLSLSHLLIRILFMQEWVKQKCAATFPLVTELTNQLTQAKHGSTLASKILMRFKTSSFIRRILI